MKIRDLSVEERIRLVEDIWDSIAEDQGALPLTDAQREELDRRLEAYRVTKDPGEDAVEVIERIRAAL